MHRTRRPVAVAFGATDAFGYNIIRNPVSVRDLRPAIPHRFRFPGRGLRPTAEGRVLKELLA
jgi:hypothetical protein